MDSLFRTPLVVRAPEPGEAEWTLMEDFEFQTDPSDSLSETILIRQGFTTDFASVPRLLWWLYPPYSPAYGKAAVLHDGLYCAHIYPRVVCDALFVVGMRDLGARAVTRRIMGASVAMWGGPVYDRHTPEQVSVARTKVIRIDPCMVPAYRAGAVDAGTLMDIQRRELPA